MEKLNGDKAIGGDKVSPFVLKKCSRSLKQANVTTLFKKGSKLEPGNYRPVSLTSICSKIMEGIVRDAILDYLYEEDLISPRQHGFVRKWIKAYLSNRKQRVVLGDSESSWQSVTSSVSQGTVLGPLLFVIYINDLPDGLKNNCEMYANDNKVLARNEDGQTMGYSRKSTKSSHGVISGQ